MTPDYDCAEREPNLGQHMLLMDKMPELEALCAVTYHVHLGRVLLWLLGLGLLWVSEGAW